MRFGKGIQAPIVMHEPITGTVTGAFRNPLREIRIWQW